MLNDAKKETWRQWAVDGMPLDKRRLAEAVWADAVEACAAFADEHGMFSETQHAACQGCGEDIAAALRKASSNA